MDEAVVGSFPASDPPGWTDTHAGGPSPRPTAHEHAREIRTALRADLELLRRPAIDVAARRAMLEELVARAMLDAGRAIMREPVDDALRVHNIEAEVPGTARERGCVVVGARYDDDDPSGTAMLLAVVRQLGPAPLRRAVRFVAFASKGGSERYVERLKREGSRVEGMLSLAAVNLARGRRDPPVVFVANLRSSALARSACRAFGVASRIPVQAVVLPSWLPGVSDSDHAPFWRARWPALLVVDRSPWRVRWHRGLVAPDVDRMAAAVPGFTSAVARLAGGRE